MISFYIPGEEAFDETTEEIIETDSVELNFEHSLKSISIWEAKYKRSFLMNGPSEELETLDYLSMMCTNADISPIYLKMHPEIIIGLDEYIKDPHTATVVKTDNSSTNNMVMTSEVIYAYMANGQIPFSCDEWNINNLLKVISVLGALNGPKKSKSMTDIYEENRRLNQESRAKLKSKV